MTERIGNWMQTATGRPFWVMDPRPEDICIEDIAHALSLVCRFGGHCKFHYSVAQHSVLVAEHLWTEGRPSAEQRQRSLLGLLHDAAEAYVGDVIWPVKQIPEVKAVFRRLEADINRCIAIRFGIPFNDDDPIIKQADLVVLATEKRDVMADGPGKEDGADREMRAARERLGGWHCDHVEPLTKRIEMMSPAHACEQFLDLFERLGGRR